MSGCNIFVFGKKVVFLFSMTDIAVQHLSIMPYFCHTSRHNLLSKVPFTNKICHWHAQSMSLNRLSVSLSKSCLWNFQKTCITSPEMCTYLNTYCSSFCRDVRAEATKIGKLLVRGYELLRSIEFYKSCEIMLIRGLFVIYFIWFVIIRSFKGAI